jgi:hypothetical protein
VLLSYSRFHLSRLTSNYLAVFILYAAAIFASAWFLGQAKSAMYMGIFVMAVSWLSDFLHPRPGDTITFLGVTYKAAFDPTVIVCFNIFLYANSTAVNESKPSTSSHLLSKVWIVIYAAVLGSLTAGIILAPVNMYLPTVGRENWDATPKPIQMAMERVAFVFSLLLALASTTPSIFWVFRYHKPIGPLLFILCFWTLALGFAHLVYPFPNEGMTVPELVDGVPAPIFIVGGISILMSSICLYVENRRSTAAFKSKQS